MIDFVIFEKANQKVKEKFKMKTKLFKFELNNYNSLFLNIYNKTIETFSNKLNNSEILLFYKLYNLNKYITYNDYENELYFIKYCISLNEIELKKMLADLENEEVYQNYIKEQNNNKQEIIKVIDKKEEKPILKKKEKLLIPMKNNDENKNKNFDMSEKELRDFINNVNRMKTQKNKK